MPGENPGKNNRRPPIEDASGSTMSNPDSDHRTGPSDDHILETIAHICATETSANVALKALAEPLRNLVPYDRLLISMVKPVIGSTEIFFQTGIEVKGRPEGWNAPVQKSLVQEIVRSKKSWLNPDVDESVFIAFPSTKPAVDAGVRSWIATPLLSNGDCLGVMQFQSLRPGDHSEQHVKLAEMVSALIASRFSDQMAIDRRRTEAESTLDDAGERAIVADLGHLIHSSPELSEVYPRFSSLLKQLIPFDGIQISILDPESDEWKVGYTEGPTPTDGIAGKGKETDSTYTSFALAQPGPITLSLSRDDEVEAMLERFPSMRKWIEIDLRSTLSAPLVTRGEAMGVLHLWSTLPNAFTESQEKLLEQIAIYVASAVNNAELLLRQRLQIEQRAAIAEIGTIITSSLSYEDEWPEFTRLLRNVVPWERIALSLFREDDDMYSIQFVTGTGSLSRVSGEKVPLTGSFARHVADLGRPIALNIDNKHDAELINSKLDGLARAAGAGIKSFLAAPLIANDGLLGTVHLSSSEAGVYSEDHVLAMRQIASHLATAIANAQLKARIEEESAQKTIIAKLGQILSSDVYLNNVLPDFHNELKKLISADRLVVSTYDPQHNRFDDRYILGIRIPGWDGDHTRATTNLNVHKITEAKEGWIVPSARIIAATHASDPGLAATYSAGLKSAMYMPLVTGGRITGSLNLKSTAENAYSRHELDILERVALQVAGSVAAAESFQQALEAAKDRERRVRAETEKADLEEESNERSRFITQVGHELRTPLTTMLAFADILRRNKTNNLEDGQIEKLNVIQRNGRRLAVLVDDMLDLSRIELGDYELEYNTLDITSVILDVAEDFQPIVTAKGQNLVIDAPDQPIIVEVDPQRLAQVISAALSNASSYSPEDSTIELAISSADGNVQITITDEGAGISPDFQQKVFDLFFRVDNEVTRRVPGTGIGLYVAKTIVEAHGGSIDISSSLGSGVKIRIELPIQAPSVPAQDESAA